MTRTGQPHLAQRRDWVERICANVDCGERYWTQNARQLYCTPNCNYRAHHRRYRAARRLGRAPTPLQRLLARLSTSGSP